MLKDFKGRIKSHKRGPKKIRKNLDSLIHAIEEIKEDFDLEKIFRLLSDKLYDLDISSLMLIIDEKDEKLIIRNISLTKFLINPGYLLPEELIGTKVDFEENNCYSQAIKKKKSYYCTNRYNKIIKRIPEIKNYIVKSKFNSIVTPLIIRGKTIGVIEFFSSNIRESEIEIFDNFSKNLVKNIANMILFQAVRESEQRYRKLVDNAKDVVLIIDEKGSITYANKSFYEQMGYEKFEMGNLHFSKLIYPDDLPVVLDRFKRRLKGEVMDENYEFRVISKKGQVKWISFNGVPIMKQNGIAGIQAIIRDISENKLLQEKYKESKDHYEQVIDAIQDGICVIDKDFKIISYNKIFAKKIGINIKELKGNNYREIIPNYENQQFKDFCCLKCRENCIIEKVFHTGESIIFTKKSHGKENQVYYHRISVFPKKDKAGFTYETVIIIRNITKKMKDEEQIRVLGEFNQKILDNSPVSILVLNKSGRIISANNNAEKIIGMAKDDIIGTKLIKYQEISMDKQLVDKYEKLLSIGEPFYYDSFFYNSLKDKKKNYLNIYAVPLFDKKGNIEGAISMALDNTEAMHAKNRLKNLNKELENKVMERTDELNEINKRLEQAVKLKSKFISDASHELRTPLTVIQGNMDLAVREAEMLKQEPSEFYELVLSEVDRMARILSDLTILTNIDANSEQLMHEEVDLAKVVTASCRSLSVLADQKKIALMYKKGNKNFKIYGDEAKLEKLLLNIIRNAIKYTNEKGKIKVAINKVRDNVCISIADTGIGIPKEDLPYIFERFYRVDKARSRQEGGTGLGLAICKWISEAHGGRVEVDSEVDVGTTFKIYLPLERPNSQK